MFFKKNKAVFSARRQPQVAISQTGSERLSLRIKLKNFRFASREIWAFLFLAAAAWALLQSARFSAITSGIGEKALFAALSGKENLESAKARLASQDLSHAALELSSAVENFKKSQSELAYLEKNLLGTAALFPQRRLAQNLLSASLDLAQAGQSAVNFAALSSNLSFGASGLTRGNASFDDLEQELKNFETHLKFAHKKIKKTSLRSLPEPDRLAIEKNLLQIGFALDSASSLNQLLFLGKTFFTGKNKILLLMQNPNELRPTGGFLGTFGDMELSDGIIASLKIASTYDLDGQLTENIQPPLPLLSVNDRWYLRDANWFASFNESAKKIGEFFEKEGGQTPDLTIALTPQAIAEILKITGPLADGRGGEVNVENLSETLQILTQSDPADPSNEPKKILGQMFTELFQKIERLPGAEKGRVLRALQQGLTGKQILLYSRLPAAQKIFEDFNWAGKIDEKADRDYLLIAGANLGGTKTDLEISQNLKLESKISPNGQIENQLTISRTNRLPPIAGAQNKTFLRIYLPAGTKFLEAQGFDRIGSAALRPPDGQKKDFEALKWEKSLFQDIASGTLIGQESGKTFFGNWVILAGGETRALTLKYLLPFVLKKLDRHSLLVQKQPGTPDFSFEYSLGLPSRQIEWQNFAARPSGPDSLNASLVLNKDAFFGMVLKKRD